MWPIDTGWGPEAGEQIHLIRASQAAIANVLGQLVLCRLLPCLGKGPGPLLIYLQPILLNEKFGITDAFTILHLWQTPFL